jgi:low temperature requirement protein LtrA
VSVQIRIRMLARSADETHRASSQLELLFDLTFVIAARSGQENRAVARVCEAL